MSPQTTLRFTMYTLTPSSHFRVQPEEEVEDKPEAVRLTKQCEPLIPDN